MNGDGPAPGDSRRRQSIFSKLRAVIGAPATPQDATPQDIAEAVQNGDDAAMGELSAARREMIERVVAFDEKRVVDVMAPRADICAVDIETPFDALVRAFVDAGHSRMPVYRGELDDPVGMVHIKDVVGLIADKSAAAGPVLGKIKRDILYAPPSMRVTDLLLRMQASRIHMALVVDEYGGTDGLVTIEDLVEEIVGDINDEHDEDDAPAIAPAGPDGWDVDARVELDEFADETGVRLMMEDDEIDTIGGYAVSLAGRVPQRGEVFAGVGGLDFEIAEADARKVRRVRIRPSAKPNKAAE